MANRSKEATWASVKAELQQMDPKALVDLIRDLYRSNQENRRFLHARLIGSQTELAKYRKLVIDAIYPEPFSRRPIRVSEARRLIEHYRKATSDTEGTVELKLTFVEAGTEQAADLGYGDARYFGALVRALDDIVAALAGLSPDSSRQAVARIQRIAARADSIGWGYGDYAQEIAGLAQDTLTSARSR